MDDMSLKTLTKETLEGIISEAQENVTRFVGSPSLVSAWSKMLVASNELFMLYYPDEPEPAKQRGY